MFVIAFDPGGTTGVAVVDHMVGRSFKLVSSFEYTWDQRFQIHSLLATHQRSIKAIVIEEYRLFETPKTLHAQINSEIPSARVIGLIELAAYLADLGHVIHWQKPSDIHYTDPETKKRQYSVTIDPEFKPLIKRSQHCVDAFLHAKFYVLTVGRKHHGKYRS